MNNFVKVRSGGEYLNILKEDNITGDIFVGNPDDGDNNKVKIYRGGTSQTIKSSEFDNTTMQIEYTYTKHETIEEDGVLRLKTDAELLEDAKAKVKLQLAIKINNDVDYIMTGDKTKYDKIYDDIEKAKSIEEIPIV